MNNKQKKTTKWTREPPYANPKINIQPHLENKGEGYLATYDKGVINIAGNNKVGEAQGQSFFNSLLSSRHWPEFLGRSEPMFPFRAIWLECKISAWLLSQTDGKFESFSEKMIGLGYNVLILGGIHEPAEASYTSLMPSLKRCLACLKDKKITLVLNLASSLNPSLHSSNLSDAYKRLFDAIQEVPMILVASQIHEESLDMKEGNIYLDKIKEEIHRFERLALGRFGLIYYLPYSPCLNDKKQFAFLRQLSLGISDETILAFSASRGCPTYDHLPAHPFWNELRCMQEALGTRLMPIINFGRQGWPSIAYDLFETYFSRCYRHGFVGMAAYASHIPEAGELSHCNLWVAGQMQWRFLPPDAYIETWFKSHRPELDYSECRDLFQRIRGVILELNKVQYTFSNSTYHPEELRLIFESE
jgi:hypothetical protein